MTTRLAMEILIIAALLALIGRISLEYRRARRQIAAAEAHHNALWAEQAAYLARAFPPTGTPAPQPAPVTYPRAWIIPPADLGDQVETAVIGDRITHTGDGTDTFSTDLADALIEQLTPGITLTVCHRADTHSIPEDVQ